MRLIYKSILVLYMLMLSVHAPLMVAHANELIADISTHNVILDYSFKGQYITVSGITDKINDIIMTVEGPNKAYRIWEKGKVKGIWINTESFTIPDVLSYFFIFANRDLAKIAPIQTLKKHGIKLNDEKYAILEQHDQPRAEKFQEQFLQYRQNMLLYSTQVGLVDRVSENIFRAKFFVPQHAMTGTYKVMIYGFENGKLKKTVPLLFRVRKLGLYDKIDEMSKHKPLKYSLIAIFLALSAGAVAGFLFRNDR